MNPESSDTVTVLEMQGICKSFIGEDGEEIKANDSVTFTLKRGEVHALLGENGAGKSTLVMNLCREPDSGTVVLNGETVELQSPRDALKHGIGIAYQDLTRTLVERHTIAENILSLATGFLLSPSAMEEAIREALVKYDLGELDPQMSIWKLSGGEKQRVEILKALITNPDILMLDEPTSMQTPLEVEKLFSLIETLKAQGKSIVIITHHLGEAIRISDRITVLRSGKVVDTLDEARVEAMKKEPEEGARELAQLMVGRELLYDLERKELQEGPIVLATQDLCVNSDMGVQVVNSVSLEVRGNQILGIAGIAGNGQRELVESIVHWREAMGGSISLHGEDITNRPVKEIRDRGVSFVPEIRKKALILDLSVRANLMISYYAETPGLFIDREAMIDKTDKLIERFSIETPSPLAPVRSLSGGNRQKVVVARELSRQPPKGEQLLLIAENPTFGLDVATTQFVRQELLKMRTAGAAVLLVSSDLTEILTLSDMIAVMYKGEIVGVLDADSATRESVGLLMGGVVDENSSAGEDELIEA
ncbi:MAG: ABC transporter ATP-binding protein [Candidatus Thorarchaeota archaeon]